MRRSRWTTIAWLALLAGCTQPAQAPTPASRTPVAATSEAPVPAPTLTVVALVDPDSDSPFRWDPVLAEGTAALVEDGTVWAPVAPVVAVLDPEAKVELAAGKLRIDGELVDVPAKEIEGVAWAEVGALARAFGAFAYGRPGDASIALWPERTLRWLAVHGDKDAPVLAQARGAGVVAAAEPVPVAGPTAALRVRNTGPDAAMALRVQFPPGEVDFGDVAANATSAYRPVPGGVYAYAAYRLRLDGREVTVPVIDWVGESPMEGAVFTYVVAVDAKAKPPVTLLRVERDR